MKYRIVSLLVSFIILAALILLSDIGQLVESILQANLFYIGLAVAMSVVLIFLRVVRWDLLLRGLNIRVNFGSVFHVFMGGNFISNITPAKSGDPVRSYFLKKKTKVSFSKNLPSVVVERIFDILTMGIGAVLGVFIIASLARQIGNILGLVIGIYVVIILAVIYFGTNEKRLKKLLDFSYRFLKFIPRFKKMQNKIEYFALNFNKSIAKYRKRPYHVFAAFVLSVIVWIVESLIFYACFLSLGIGVSAVTIFFIMSISVLVGVLSALPGGLGSFEVVMVLLFTTIYGFPIPTVTASILIARFAGFWLNMGVGAVSLGFKI